MTIHKTMAQEVAVQRAYNFLSKPIRSKEKDRERIEQDVAEWLAKGNQFEPAIEFPDVKSRRAYGWDS